MTVSDEEMDEFLQTGNVAAIRAAVAKDPGLLKRGWRNGVYGWVRRAVFGPLEVTLPVLLELGADINAESDMAGGGNALYSAVLGENVEHTKLLLENGANPRKKEDIVWSAIVRSKNQLELVKLLDQFGADIHWLTKAVSQDATPIH